MRSFAPAITSPVPFACTVTTAFAVCGVISERAPCRDAGNLRELRAAPCRARRLLALGDQRIERGRPLRRDGQTLGNDERDAVLGKRIRDVRDGNLHGSALCPS